MALTIWEVCGYRRDDDREVHMSVEAPEPPCGDGPDSHFAVANRIAGDGYYFVGVENIGTVPPGFEKNVLLLYRKPPRPSSTATE